MSTASELAHLFRALKAPAAARALPRLADRARAEEWSYEHFAQTLLETEVSARDSHGGEARIRQARFPARKTLEEFDFSFQRSVKKTVIEHLGQLDFLHAKECIVALGPPGTGKTHCETPFLSRPGRGSERLAPAVTDLTQRDTSTSAMHAAVSLPWSCRSVIAGVGPGAAPLASSEACPPVRA
jgi:IstB-like ATP binding protein